MSSGLGAPTIWRVARLSTPATTLTISLRWCIARTIPPPDVG
jgi:hypothetical protein